MENKKIVFFDFEVEPQELKIIDIGATTNDQAQFHQNNPHQFVKFIGDTAYLAGHNIFKHDLKYCQEILDNTKVKYYIDTLYWSPLLFPIKPYHKLVKDEKLITEEFNNPLVDSIKALELFNDEITSFLNLDPNLKTIFYLLLKDITEFKDFFTYIDFKSETDDLADLIFLTLKNKICENAPLQSIIKKYPVELAYAISQINVIETQSLTPAWILINYPRVENILHHLRNRQCQGCPYCKQALDPIIALKRYFGFPSFRSYDGKQLQLEAVEATLKDKSILAIFPTGGGKSITFQLPALLSGENELGLTVVISPLQSLMKDQVDNLEQKYGITRVATINGSLNVFERSKVIERVEEGQISLLYISPESLRSKTIERLLLKRNVVRFVIDEAHCFSSWGQDFRVDYLYIGEFIKNIQAKKNIDSKNGIPVSCFTATAKSKVVEDILKYFKEQLNLELTTFIASSARSNLDFHCFMVTNNQSKYQLLKQLLENRDCPTIIYVARTATSTLLANQLSKDGFKALPYTGKMDSEQRIINQDLFKNDQVSIIVATTAFGMGVDKEDVGMVIHYDISSSLENYLQEAGRAGRKSTLQADCYILYNEDDLNKHFILVNQSKLSVKEVQQVWKAIKEFTKKRPSLLQTPLEIARKSGWNEDKVNLETNVKTAISILEKNNFIKRGLNDPRIFADSIMVENMAKVAEKIDQANIFESPEQIRLAKRIISSLISEKYCKRGSNQPAESFTDYLADRLGVEHREVIRVICLLKELKILGDHKDVKVTLKKAQKLKSTKGICEKFYQIESLIVKNLSDHGADYNIKELNELIPGKDQMVINEINLVLNDLEIKKLIIKNRKDNPNYIRITPIEAINTILKLVEERYSLNLNIIDYLFNKVKKETKKETKNNDDEVSVMFSVLELKEQLNSQYQMKVLTKEIEDGLEYLNKINALKIDGSFLVSNNKFNIERIELNNRISYSKENHKQMEDYYQQKNEQIHIVGEYVKRMNQDLKLANDFVKDYFEMNYDHFLFKYFKNRKHELNKNITPSKYQQLFGDLSSMQRRIIDDHQSDYIVVAAGPGSGKTKLLVHKLASLCLMEDVKYEQLLMLTFSRASAIEFKKRLSQLLGTAVNFITITTFHSYCFDLLCKVGDLDNSNSIIVETIKQIEQGMVEGSKLTKTVLVIDEAQDMSEDEYLLVKTLIKYNESLRVIMVGDDDQNIYSFRGSDPRYFSSLLKETKANKYELVTNYRSNANIVEFANRYVLNISNRLKHDLISANKKTIGQFIIKTISSNRIVEPIVDLFLNTPLTGSTCIMARQNEEVLNIVSLLNDHGINAKQVSTNRKFRLGSLKEVRSLIVDLEEKSNNGIIGLKDYQQAKIKLTKDYQKSTNLELVLNLLADFEITCNKSIYLDDFKNFVFESKLEDFITSTNDMVLVSTIHQAKGKQYDNVFIGLSNSIKNDDYYRLVYVALTRAINNLYIVTNDYSLSNISSHNCLKIKDPKQYSELPSIIIELSHEDVALGSFGRFQKAINQLTSGDKLEIGKTGAFYKGKKVLTYSMRFMRKLVELKEKGYLPQSMVVNHLVYWRGKDQVDQPYVLIVLAKMKLVKSNS